MLNKIKKFANKRRLTIGILFVVLISFVLISPTAHAQMDWAVSIVGGIARALVSALGWVLTKLVAVLIYVSTYDTFIHSQAVFLGWKISRDLANMFFIVILLIISFATILQQEKYNYKQWLPKLILMAVLINFSKTICGILIDLSQIVMLTFVNAFSEIGAGNLTEMLGMADWNTLKKDTATSGWELTAAYILSFFYVLIALAVIASMTAMLVMRIVMIWIYVVLSPFAYLLASFPGGANYSSQWWSEFTKNLIIGPVLAFFIWLSFASLASPEAQQFKKVSEREEDNLSTGASESDKEQIKILGGTTTDLMIKFVISIGMLIGGMQIAQSIGGVAGAAAGKTMGKLKKTGTSIAKGAGVAAGAATGLTFAKRRFGEWRKDTKQNMQKSTDLRYEKAKGKVSGVVAGVAGDIGDSISNLESPLISSAKNYKKERVKKKKERKRHKEAQYNAYHDGIYEDEKGEKYKYDESSKTYKNDRGETAKYTNKKGDAEDVVKLSDDGAKFEERYRDKQTKAKALQNEIADEKTSKEQKILTQAGVSNIDLKNVLADSSNSASKRMAAAVELAMKNGFKSSNLKEARQNVASAKDVFGDNMPMLSKFNQTINKRFAALNHDLESESGRRSYKAALAGGEIDGYRQDASTYDKQAIRVLDDFSGKDFEKNMASMMSLSKEHRNMGGSALREAKREDLSKGQKLLDPASDELNRFAKVLAKSGDIEGAFNNSKDSSKLVWDADSNEAHNKFLKTASAAELGKTNNDYLDLAKLTKIMDKKGVTATGAEMAAMKTSIEQNIVQNVSVSKVASIETRDDNAEFVKRFIGLVNSIGTEEQKAEILSNNMLKNIKPLP